MPRFPVSFGGRASRALLTALWPGTIAEPVLRYVFGTDGVTNASLDGNVVLGDPIVYAGAFFAGDYLDGNLVLGDPIVYAGTLEPGDLAVDGNLVLGTAFVGPGTFVVGSVLCYVDERDPAPGAIGWRGPDRIRFLWLAVNSGDPVREVSITATVNGVAATVATSSVPGGFLVEIIMPLNEGTTYTVSTSADTVASTGDPATFGWSFTTAHRVASRITSAGFIRGGVQSRANAQGAARAMPGSRVVAYGISRGASLFEAQPVVAAGSVGLSVTLRQAMRVIAQGWITEYVTQWVPGVVEVGPRAFVPVPAVVEAENPEGIARGVAGGVEVVRGDAVLPGVRASIETYTIDYQVVASSVEVGNRVQTNVTAAVEVTGMEADTLVVVDSPSAGYVAEDEP